MTPCNYIGKRVLVRMSSFTRAITELTIVEVSSSGHALVRYRNGAEQWLPKDEAEDMMLEDVLAPPAPEPQETPR